jgi:hypothetical protein
MDFEIQVTQSVTETEESAWDHLSGRRHYASHRWYRFGEAVLEDCPPTYIILSHAGEPVARAAFWLKRREWLPFTSRLARSGVERLLQRWPVLTCEAPLASAPGLILPEEASLRAAALEAIAETALRLGKEQGASIVMFGYTESRQARLPGWPGTFLPISYSDAETSLEIAWPNYDDYLKSLAKSTRRNYKLHGKRAAELEIIVEAHPSVSDIEAALALIRNVEAHHRVGHRPWARGMLENAALIDSTWITARIGSRLVGCCSLFGETTYQLATLLGLDYSFPDSIYTYYQIIYAAVRCAIERGAKVLYGGGGAYELKRRLGFCTLSNDSLVATGTGRISRWLVRGLARWTGGQDAVHAAILEDERNQGETNHEL